MRGEPGVYTLVMWLDSEQDIIVDKKGTQNTFPVGWYVYVGSARGPGGLKRRTERHQKRVADGKRMHWNVDYFREVAQIQEIWYSYTGSERWEHDWAKTAMKMQGATIPVFGFGANDCKWGCDAHFFFFPNRPLPVAFRWNLAVRFRKHPEVLVDFNDFALERLTGESLDGHYQRGRRFLEKRRQALLSNNFERDSLMSFAQKTLGRELLDQLASGMGRTPDSLKTDIKLALAVETIVENCGESAVDAIFRSKRSQEAQAVLKLSRKSREVQQHRVQRVLDPNVGDWSLAPKGSEKISDTMNFTKILSRLARARGSVETGQNLIDTCDRAGLASDWVMDIVTTLHRFEPILNDHARLVRELGVLDESETGDQATRSLSTRLRLSQLPTQLKSAIGLIEKNVRDMPRSSYDLQPTGKQVKIAQREISRIRQAVRRLAQMLATDGETQ